VRVLIADDEAVARKGLRALLASRPDVAIVGEAATGEETEALLRSTDPDVSSSTSGCRKGGLDVVAGMDPASLPLVIFATAHDEHAIRAFELHALDYLVKPCREDRLRDAIGRARASWAGGISGPSTSASATGSRRNRRIRRGSASRTRTASGSSRSGHSLDRSPGLLRAAASRRRAHSSPRHVEAIPAAARPGGVRARA
jgi:DNA-binding LytR/AlgR family response regulator